MPRISSNLLSTSGCWIPAPYTLADCMWVTAAAPGPCGTLAFVVNPNISRRFPIALYRPLRTGGVCTGLGRCGPRGFPSPSSLVNSGISVSCVMPDLHTGQERVAWFWSSHPRIQSQLPGRYQYKCPQGVTTGSLATSMQMLHSNLELSLPDILHSLRPLYSYIS
jgi:hypothetical protein